MWPKKHLVEPATPCCFALWWPSVWGLDLVVLLCLARILLSDGHF